jgi:hypothetical protein
MKEANKKTWDELESQWREKLRRKEEPVPPFAWELLDAKASRKIIPIWWQLDKPWVWAAALALAIGLNWQGAETKQGRLPDFAALQVTVVPEKKSVPKKQVSSSIAIHPMEIVQNTPFIETQIPAQEISQVKSIELAIQLDDVKDSVLTVRVDIESIVEPSEKPEMLADVQPVKRKKNLFGQIFKQVFKSQPGGWREITSGSEKLTNSIHWVANNTIKVEQSVTQQFQ